jgi:hypothetical protein
MPMPTFGYGASRMRAALSPFLEADLRSRVASEICQAHHHCESTLSPGMRSVENDA